MTMHDRTDNHATTDDQPTIPRRTLLGVGALLGTSVLTGCLSDDGGATSPDGTGTPAGDDEEAGRFRLLISDQPVAIDDFDSLTVWLDEARVFPEGSPDDDDADTPTPTPDSTPEPTPSPTPNESDDNSTADGLDANISSADGQQGFFFLDLEDASVDLTQVIGDKAIEVFDGELEAGRYTKIELYPSDVEGIVDDEEVTVHIPSDRLQIVTPFEIVAGEELSFVFDINVVRRGQGDEYNLTPVIAESGVVGEDLEGIEEIDPDEDDDDGADDDEETGENEEDGTDGENGGDSDDNDD